MFISGPNIAEAGNITATGPSYNPEANVMPASNLLLPQKYHRWRSTEIDSCTIICDWSTGDEVVHAAILGNCNLSQTAEIEWHAYGPESELVKNPMVAGDWEVSTATGTALFSGGVLILTAWTGTIQLKNAPPSDDVAITLRVGDTATMNMSGAPVDADPNDGLIDYYIQNSDYESGSSPARWSVVSAGAGTSAVVTQVTMREAVAHKKKSLAFGPLSIPGTLPFGQFPFSGNLPARKLVDFGRNANWELSAPVVASQVVCKVWDHQNQDGVLEASHFMVVNGYMPTRGQKLGYLVEHVYPFSSTRLRNGNLVISDDGKPFKKIVVEPPNEGTSRAFQTLIDVVQGAFGKPIWFSGYTEHPVEAVRQQNAFIGELVRPSGLNANFFNSWNCRFEIHEL